MSDLIDAILVWATTNPRFDTKFVKSVRRYNDRHDRVTSNQMQALENIITRWCIPFRRELLSDYESDDVEDEPVEDDDVTCVELLKPTRCPLTGALFMDPVKHCRCGHVYERTAAIEHIRISGRRAMCPVAGCPRRIADNDLVPICEGDVRRDVSRVPAQDVIEVF